MKVKYLGVLQFDSVKYDNKATTVSIVRSGAGIVDWRKNELEAIDRNTRKFLTMQRSSHPTADVDIVLALEQCPVCKLIFRDRYCINCFQGSQWEEKNWVTLYFRCMRL